ncbi:hypothetical protein LguiB_027899 [Lonicera macranthoides]
MKARDGEPNVFTYSILINGYSKSKMIDEALRLFNDMSRKGLIPNIVTYNTIIGGLCDVGKPLDACVLVDEMQTHGQQPNLVTYATLLVCLCKEKRLDEALLLFKMIEDNGLVPDIVIYNILVDGMCSAGKLDAAKELLLSLPKKGLQPATRSYNIMINGLCKEGKLKEVNELLSKMKEHGCSPNDCTYNIIVRGFLQNNEMSEALQHLQTMLDSGFSADASTMDLVFNLLSTDRLDPLCKEELKNAIILEALVLLREYGGLCITPNCLAHILTMLICFLEATEALFCGSQLIGTEPNMFGKHQLMGGNNRLSLASVDYIVSRLQNFKRVISVQHVSNNIKDIEKYSEYLSSLAIFCILLSFFALDIPIFKEKYQIPDSVRIRAPGPEEQACCYRPGEVCFYESAFVHGLRFLIDNHVKELLVAMDLAPS